METNQHSVNYKHTFSYLKESFLKYKYLFIVMLYFVAVINILELVERLIFKQIIDSATEYSMGLISTEVLIGIGLLMGFLFVLIMFSYAIGEWFSLHLLIKLQVLQIYDFRVKVFSHTIGLSHNFHINHKTGSMISKIIRGSSAMESISDNVYFAFAPFLFQMIASISLLAVFNFTTAMIVSVIVIIFLGYGFFITHIRQKYVVIANKNEDSEKGLLSDFLTNIDSIKYFGKEELVKEKFNEKAVITYQSQQKQYNYFRWMDSGQSFISTLGLLIITGITFFDYVNGLTTLGTITLVYTTYLGLLGPMYRFTHGSRRFVRNLADLDSGLYYLREKNEIKNESNAKNLEITKGKIEFKNINFSYPKNNLFQNFNLKIEPEQKVALVGHSGSGKTSLVKLLYRLFDLESGKILIDEQDISKIKQESLRSGLSIVPQETILFDDTIYNNVAFSNPNATKEEVMNALKFAQLDEVVKYFPYQESTIVGERGVKLSGGEKQRVSIARAILANKKILILDEATSALDSKTESEIQKDLKRLMKGRTTLIIAHRLSTIMSADKIIVLEKGKIIQQGTHNELISQDGAYKKLWELQKGGYIETSNIEKMN